MSRLEGPKIQNARQEWATPRQQRRPIIVRASEAPPSEIMGRKHQRSRKGKGGGKGGAEEKRPELRFSVGDRVKCWMCDDEPDELEELFKLSMQELLSKMVLTDSHRSQHHGTVVQHWWREPGTKIVHPYQIRLDDGTLIYARTDTDQCIEKGDVPAPRALGKVEAAGDPTLFQPCPQREECPICTIPLPLQKTRQTKYFTCCGQVICLGCVVGADEGGLGKDCPFCRAPPVPRASKEWKKRMNDRIEKNDPEALSERAVMYFQGTDGFPKNEKKAFELVSKAASLGLCTAHFDLGYSYTRGVGVKPDSEKARHHLEIAAKMGHGEARQYLGNMECASENYVVAFQHYLIGARGGYDNCLEMVKRGFKKGHVTKDDFADALRAHKASQDALRSEQRDKARASYPWTPSIAPWSLLSPM